MFRGQSQERVLNITTLGRFRVTLGDQVLSEDTSRASRVWQLFKYLVTNRERDIPTDTIIANLWPEGWPKNAERALRNLVYRLRQSLGSIEDPPHNYITLSQGMYKFNTKAQYWLDTEEFEQRFAELKGMTLSQAVGQVKKYQECLNLYQGEYLPEELHADWVVPVWNYYRRIYLETFADYIKILNVLNDLPAIGAACEQALLVEPLEEAVHIQFIDYLLQTGKTNDALAHYSYASSMLYREMGIKPSPEMIMAYRRS